MPAPSVFISSTFYDLRYIRENLRFFVRSLGYHPVLSERGAVFFDPQRSAAEAAVAEVSSCQLFVLILGGRYGSELQDGEQSITNAEYQEAVRMHIPVFALVEQGTFADYEVWRANRTNDGLDDMSFPNADDPRIFEFIDEVQSQAVNNALVPFRDFADIEAYLRTQWASLLHAFLARTNAEERVAETLGGLERISQRVEILSTQILESVGTAEAKLMADMYDQMLGSRAVQDLMSLDLRPSPVDVLRQEDFFTCARALGGIWEIGLDDEDDEDGATITTTRAAGRGQMSQWHAEVVRRDYRELREKLQQKLEESGLTLSTLEARVEGGHIEPESV